MSKLRLGVFGGTFDPIHNTHLAIACAARRQARLDKVLFVVAANPPHKMDATCASADDRLALVEAAISSLSGMEVSRIELERKGASYTADTLEAIKAAQPDAEIYLILGMDALMDLPRWKSPERILAAASLLAVPRPGECVVPPMLDGRFELLDFPETDISSTDIRRRIADGDPCEDALPGDVRRLIAERGLYRECPEHTPRG
ncbi:MAG: putative nicotinate-nucleotide adenylyltransferase [Candidatus Hydrogenedentota bacterium]